jgi:uncharacterized membrane protein
MKTKHFITQLEHDRIVAAIRAAEQKTSGEIRVFISRHDPADALKAAQADFVKLGMDKTRDKNGVLIFVAPLGRKFAVIGDSAVHERCGDPFWTSLAAEITGHFKRGAFTDGIVHAISKAGELLSQHFPKRAGDTNQLSDEIAHD